VIPGGKITFNLVSTLPIVVFGAYAAFGSFFLKWYEGDWGAVYYLETYGSGLWSNFDLMIETARYGGSAAIAAGVVLLLISRNAKQSRSIYSES